MEEVARSGIFLTALSGFLCCHEIGIGEGFGFNLLTVEQVKQLRQEHVEGTAVNHEVMDVHHQIHPLFGGDNLHTIKRPLSQVEGLDKLPFVMGNVLLLVLALSNLNGLFEVHHLDDVCSRTSKVSLQHGVRLDEGLGSLGEQCDVHIFGETGNDRCVVDGGFGILDGIHIHTHLGIRQRNAARVSMCRLGFLLFGSASTHQCRQNLVLNALNAACLCQSLGVQRHAKALVNLDSQLDGHDGRETYIAQHGGHTKVFVVDDA